MNCHKPSAGTAHELPQDLQKALIASSKALAAWQDITPLARNEFICWVEDAKQAKTRVKRIERAKQELLDGKRWPCCWSGCIHRTDKPMSNTQKWLASKNNK